MTWSRFHGEQSSDTSSALLDGYRTQPEAFEFIAHVAACKAESLAVVVNHQGHLCVTLPQFNNHMRGVCMFFHIV